MFDHRDLFKKFQKSTGDEKLAVWKSWKKYITDFHLAVVISYSSSDYQRKAWKLLKKYKKLDGILLRAIVAHTTDEEIRLWAAKRLTKISGK